MDLNHVKELLDLVREHDLAEFEIEHEGFRLKIRKDGVATTVATLPAAPAPIATVHAAAAPSLNPIVSTPEAAAAAETGGEEIELAVVKSPIVGTFYRSPEPGAGSFVEIGSTVKKGQVLCIIEAMKLMNEIESDCSGEIAAVYAENGRPVQFGERLFAVKVG